MNKNLKLFLVLIFQILLCITLTMSLYLLFNMVYVGVYHFYVGIILSILSCLSSSCLFSIIWNRKWNKLRAIINLLIFCIYILLNIMALVVFICAKDRISPVYLSIFYLDVSMTSLWLFCFF